VPLQLGIVRINRDGELVGAHIRPAEVMAVRVVQMDRVERRPDPVVHVVLLPQAHAIDPLGFPQPTPAVPLVVGR
jgi:hypothetical protein